MIKDLDPSSHCFFADCARFSAIKKGTPTIVYCDLNCGVYYKIREIGELNNHKEVIVGDGHRCRHKPDISG